jgi:Serine/Threonine/Tyrosine Kinase found in polyvalent proteins
MDQKALGRAAEDSPKSTAGFVRRSAQAIRASSKGVSQYRSEYLALIRWAQRFGRLLPFDYIEQFSFIGDGAEHRVYKDDTGSKLAIKATHTNKFGYSTIQDGCWASPVEYLKRLSWQNFLFGDDLRIVGIAYEDDQMEIVTSQPWISVHEIRPNPFQEEIDVYMGKFGLVSSSLDLDTPLYYSETYRIVVADAHDRNILRDFNGDLAAIDLVIGPPGEKLRERIDEFFKGPMLPF